MHANPTTEFRSGLEGIIAAQTRLSHVDGQKGQLIVQFLTESVLVSYLSLGFGLILLWYIKEQIHVSWLNWDIDHFGYLILLFFVFNLVLGVVAGASPSLILSSYQPSVFFLAQHSF